MNILVIAPHRDDEILGIGGTLLKRKAAGDRVTVCIVTAREGEVFAPKSLTATVHAEMLAAFQLCGIDQYVGLPFAPNRLESFPRKDFNNALLEVIKSSQPEVVYIPHWGDMQKDHQIVAEAAMVALRSKYNHPAKRIYAYETLSETGINLPNIQNAFIPNVYVDISEYIDKKKEVLKCYASQLGVFPDLRSIEAIDALARLRGATINVNAAEAFVLVREVQ